eukprot:1946514-Rhodomonas_salina.1
MTALWGLSLPLSPSPSPPAPAALIRAFSIRHQRPGTLPPPPPPLSAPAWQRRMICQYRTPHIACPAAYAVSVLDAAPRMLSSIRYASTGHRIANAQAFHTSFSVPPLRPLACWGELSVVASLPLPRISVPDIAAPTAYLSTGHREENA